MRPSKQPGRPPPLNPDRIAYLEAAGWRAYYERDWPKLLRLVLILCQEQFRIPFPVSLVAAYHATRAAIAWVPHDHNEAAVQRHYERFYRIAKRHAGLSYDPAAVAALELRYNDLHRRTADGHGDGNAYRETMVELHAAVFGLTRDQARESAEARVKATDVVDRITLGRSIDAEADWARAEALLRDCYRSVQRALHV